MSLKKVLPGLIFMPLEIAIFFLAMIAMESVREGRMANFGTLSEIVIQLTIATVVLAMVELLCWSAAAYWARRQIRRGLWAAPDATVKAVVAETPVREWVAASPLWTMNLLALGIATITLAAMGVWQVVVEKSDIPNGGLTSRQLALVTVALLAAVMLLAAIFAALVGVLLARRGQSTQRVLVSAFWFPVTFGLPLLLLCACEYGIGKRKGDGQMAVIMMWEGLVFVYLGVICHIFGQFLGWLVAAFYALFYQRRQRKANPLPSP